MGSPSANGSDINLVVTHSNALFAGKVGGNAVNREVPSGSLLGCFQEATLSFWANL